VTEVAIVFCPVCCSNVDVEDSPGTEVRLECVSCGQVWVMEFSPDRIAQYSPS
jgi:uncharacterized Zn finger protein